MSNYCLRCGKKIGFSGGVEIHGGMLCRKCAAYYRANKPDHGYSVSEMTYSDLLIADKKIRAAKTRRRTRRGMVLFCLVIAILAGAAITSDYWWPQFNNLVHLTEVPEEEPPEPFDLAGIPDWSGEPYVLVNGNVPSFTKEEIDRAKASAFGKVESEEEKLTEEYSPLDSLGRCGPATGCLDQSMMPEGERGEIGTVRPSGWDVKRYDFVDEEYVFNRCHLIGWQFTGQNAEPKNLITGTRYLNVDGMLPFENQAATYLRWTENHILYRVTPHFSGRDLVCRGVQIEAYSLEDDGDGLSFNVFCYNVQPGVVIDYSTGKNAAADNWKEIAEEYSKKTDSVILPQEKEESRAGADAEKEDGAKEGAAAQEDAAVEEDSGDTDGSWFPKPFWSHGDERANGESEDPETSEDSGEGPDEGAAEEDNTNDNENTDGIIAVRAYLFP